MEVLREKEDGADCEPVEFVPIDGSTISVQIENETQVLVKNQTEKSQHTMTGNEETWKSITEVFRENIQEVSSKVTYEWSSKTPSPAKIGPEIESKFAVELSHRSTWKNSTKTTHTRVGKISKKTVLLEPMTAIALEITTTTFLLNDVLVLKIEKDSVESIRNIDKNGNFSST